MRKKTLGLVLTLCLLVMCIGVGGTTAFISTQTDPIVNTFVSSDVGPIDPPEPDLNTKDHMAYIIGYPEGDVRPDNNITRAEVATIFFRLFTEDSRNHYMTDRNDFSDVSSTDWFNNAVSTLYNAGILKGYPDGTFKPNNSITRAEMAAMASRFDVVIQNEVLVDKSFSDIDGHWAKDEILFAASRGWVNGYPDGTFCPDQSITRAEAMKLINYVLGRAVDEDGLAPVVSDPDYKKWSDNTDPDVWYYYHIQEATNSHEYYRTDRSILDLPGEFYEEWQKVNEAPNWAELEESGN